jgi:ATP-binding cassette subfamily B protein
MGWWGAVGVEEEDKLDRAKAEHVIRRTAALMRPHRRAIVATVAVLVLYTICVESGPFIVKVVIDRGISPSPHLSVVEWGALIYVASALLMAVTERAQILMTNRVGEAFLRDLRVRIFRHITSQSLSFFDHEPTGRLVARMTQDIDALEMLVQQGLLVFVTSGLLLISVFVVMAVLSPLLLLLSLVTLPWIWNATRIFRRDSNVAYLEVRDRISHTLSRMQESIAGARVVQAFAGQERAVESFTAINEAQRRANMTASKIALRYFPIVEFSTSLAIALILGVGGLMVHHHLTSVGTITAFILYLNLLINPIQQVSQLFNLVQQSGAALYKLYALLDTETTVPERIGAVDLPESGDLVLSAVSFSYGGVDGEPVLSDVSLTVRVGERIALVGPTGAGKSTVAKLVARFHDPTAGEVSFGGIRLTDATTLSLRERIAVVPQEGFLFHGSIVDNVRIGRDGATEEEVEEALVKVGALQRFLALENGLDTEVRERGSRLSAGERQLLSLARAALANPALLILDEATSSLDPGTEAEVEEAMNALMAGRTVLVIAHRLSTAERADRVALIDGGRLLELGTHEQLVERGERYFALYSAWAGGRLDGNASEPEGA